MLLEDRKVFLKFAFVLLLALFLAGCQQSVTDTNLTQIDNNTSAPNIMAAVTAARGDNTLTTTATGPNLLANPSFESGTNSWQSCGAALTPSNDALSGLALQIANGCMYQDVVLQPDATYTLSCQAKLVDATGWSGTGFSVLDSSYGALAAAPESQITGSAWTEYTSTITTPANSTFASVWFYTDGAILVDNCSFTEEIDDTTPPTPSPSNMLSNSSFNSQGDWFSCGDASAYNIASGNLNMQATSCVYQTQAAEVGANYSLSCQSSANAGVYSAVTLSILNSSWATIASDTKAVTSTNIQTINLAQTAPANARYVAVTFYSEGNATHQECVLTSDAIPEGVATITTPVPQPNGSLFPYPDSHPTDNESAQAANNLLVNPTFNSATGGWINCAPNSTTISGGQLDIIPGVCFYQELVAQAGQTYTLTCKGEMNLPTYSVFTLNMLDAGFQSLATEVQTLNTSSRQWRLELQAPANTQFVTVGFYTENNATYDYCYLTVDTPAPLSSEQIYAPVKPVEVLLPIYIDPAQDITPWNQVISTAQTVATTVVVNPVIGGIEGCREESFAATLGNLQQVGVDTVGYIATGYTRTAISTVKANIDRFANCEGLDGVFFDEIKISTPGEANYYEQICTYAQSVFGNGKFVVNAGTNIEIPITNDFCNIALIYEFFEDRWDDFAVFGYQGAASDPATSIMIHTSTNVNSMKQAVDLAYSRKIDYVFVTDDTIPNPWTTLGSYWNEFINYIAQKNASL